MGFGAKLLGSGAKLLRFGATLLGVGAKLLGLGAKFLGLEAKLLRLGSTPYDIVKTWAKIIIMTSQLCKSGIPKTNEQH